MSIFYGTDTRVGKLGLYNGLINTRTSSTKMKVQLFWMVCTAQKEITLVLQSIEKSPTVQTHQRDLVKLVRVVDEA